MNTIEEKLLPKQVEVYEEAQQILSKWNMCYLALPTRFGKSFIASALTNSNTLICTTKSALPGWKKASEHFSLEPTVINYESIHKIPTHVYDTIIIDEAPKVGKFPKPSKGRQELERFIHPRVKIIWLSGSPKVESDGQLFHQLSLSPNHSFRKYYLLASGNVQGYNIWWQGSKHYKRFDHLNLPRYGTGAKKITGYNKESYDYSSVVRFDEKFNPIMIKRTHTDEKMHATVHLRYLKAPKEIEDIYHTLKTERCHQELQIEPLKPAQLLSKLHQIAQGSLIVEETTYYLSQFKAKVVRENHPNSLIFYKYQADRQQLLVAGFKEEQLKQIEAAAMGVDMSHYHDSVIFSLTWSGQMYLQALARTTNLGREDKPNVYIYLTEGTADKDIFKAVSKKKDYNYSFLKGEIC